MRNYDNLVEAINDLKSQGYTLDFNIKLDHIFCQHLDQKFDPNQFDVEEVIHFEGDDSSADSRSMLLLIKTDLGNGLMVSTNSIYAPKMTPELKAALSI